MDLSTSQKGQLAELYFEIECGRRGITACKAVTAGSRYDYVIEEGCGLRRVQVKWADGKASKSAGSFVVSLAKMTKKRGVGASEKRLYAAHEVDLVVAYVPKLERFIAIPPSLFADKSSILFRIAPALNGQAQGTRMARDYFW